MKKSLLKVADAQKVLGVSKKKMSSLLAEGSIPFRFDPLDKRVKLVASTDIQRLREVKSHK